MWLGLGILWWWWWCWLCLMGDDGRFFGKDVGENSKEVVYG